MEKLYYLGNISSVGNDFVPTNEYLNALAKTTEPLPLTSDLKHILGKLPAKEAAVIRSCGTVKGIYADAYGDIYGTLSITKPEEGTCLLHGNPVVGMCCLVQKSVKRSDTKKVTFVVNLLEIFAANVIDAYPGGGYKAMRDVFLQQQKVLEEHGKGATGGAARLAMLSHRVRRHGIDAMHYYDYRTGVSTGYVTTDGRHYVVDAAGVKPVDQLPAGLVACRYGEYMSRSDMFTSPEEQSMYVLLRDMGGFEPISYMEELANTPAMKAV